MIYKNIFLTFTFLLLTQLTAVAQDWYVLHVSGNIMNTTTNALVKSGDMLGEDLALQFDTENAKAVVIARSKGKMLLDGSKSTRNENGEFMSLVSQVLFPVQSNKMMSTRRVTFGGEMDISYYFNGGSYVFMSDSVVMKVDKFRYPLSENKKMAVRFNSDGETYNRWIENYGSENNILIDTKAVFEGVNPSHIDMVDVYYLDMSNDKPNPKHIGSFDPIFINEDKLKTELISLKTFLSEHQNESDQTVKQELYQYVLDIYGKVDEEMFKDWSNAVGVM
ncbi:hypothetical protein [Flammeovirga pacifica]|uniref:DUF4369 domain-containing protein n=1 Tax=Flammeovirga pacifica TaxID=915059 RepID=A0A1S1YX14_FLAPC|nr:hypothetical protein [Flammeovirga pacifica]OHX65570.1 hypothetical protein NH26_04010 [Flammeovirga pacifica]